MQRGDQMQTSAHPVSQEELMAYLDGELPLERGAAAAEHLEHCRECQSLAADLQSVSRQLTEWQIDEPRPQLSDELVKVLETSQVRNGPQRRPLFSIGRHPWRWVTAAGVVIVFLAIVIPGSRISHQAASMAAGL